MSGHHRLPAGIRGGTKTSEVLAMLKQEGARFGPRAVLQAARFGGIFRIALGGYSFLLLGC